VPSTILNDSKKKVRSDAEIAPKIANDQVELWRWCLEGIMTEK